MNKKSELIGLIGLLLAIFTLVFGDNIYQQITGRSVCQNLSSTNLPVNMLIAPSELLSEITDAKGVKMVLIPAGEFTMGSDTGNDPEKPAHKVYLDLFYVDKYEVTNAFYKACVDSGICQPPTQSNSATHSTYYGNSEFDDYPVIYVDWSMVKTYCEWRGAQLPTEAQWEKAARGTDRRTYPWGENVTCDKANFCGGDTTQIGAYEIGRSPYGVYDMAGNVWEWVADWYDENYYAGSPSSNPMGSETGEHRVIRGGGYSLDIDSNLMLTRLIVRWNDIPSRTDSNLGFRCARIP